MSYTNSSAAATCTSALPAFGALTAATRCSSLSPVTSAAFAQAAIRKRTLLAAETIAETICAPVPHRQLVFTIPKRLTVWQNKVFDLLLAAGMIDQETVDQETVDQETVDQETVDQMRSWPHSGFSVDNSVYLPPHDTAALQRLAEYMD